MGDSNNITEQEEEGNDEIEKEEEEVGVVDVPLLKEGGEEGVFEEVAEEASEVVEIEGTSGAFPLLST